MPEAAPLAVPTLLQDVLGLQGASVAQQLAEVVQAMQQEAQHTLEPVAPTGTHLRSRAPRDAAVGTSRLLFQVLPHCSLPACVAYMEVSFEPSPLPTS